MAINVPNVQRISLGKDRAAKLRRVILGEAWERTESECFLARQFGGGEAVDLGAYCACLDRESALVLKELDAGRTALMLAMPWLDAAAAPRRLRLLEAALAGCKLVPAQARQLLEQLNEHADRLETLESATLPALRNAQEARRLSRPD